MTKLFLELLNMSLTAGILIVVVALARHLLQKAPKNVYYVLWAMVAVRLVCPIVIESSFSLVPSQIGKVSTRQVESSFFGRMGITANHFVVVWIAGVLIMLGYSLIRYIRLYTRMCTAIRLKDDIWQSEYVITPFVFGFCNPRIYVPYNIPEEQLQMVVLHEHAHLRQKDHVIKLIAFVILSVYWFNPLVWLAFILLCRDIEVACDERVVKHMSRRERKLYSEALLSLSVSGKTIAACPVCFGEVGVKMRIKRILSYKKSSLGTRAEAVIACFLVAVCFLSNPETAALKEKIFVPKQKKEVAKETLTKQESNASDSVGDKKLAEEKDTPVKKNAENNSVEVAQKGAASMSDSTIVSKQESSEDNRVKEVTRETQDEKEDLPEDTVKTTQTPVKMDMPEESDEDAEQKTDDVDDVQDESGNEEVTEEEDDDINLIGKPDDEETDDNEETDAEDEQEEASDTQDGDAEETDAEDESAGESDSENEQAEESEESEDSDSQEVIEETDADESAETSDEV